MAMAFDARRYEREVVRPLRARRGALPDPLTRYDVDPVSMGTNQELRERLRRVRAYWSQKAMTPGNVGMVCKLLMAADERLRRAEGDRLDDLTWWRERHVERERIRSEATDRLVEDLRAGYGPAGRITRTQLEAVAAHEPRLSADQVRAAATRAGLLVIEAVGLPASCGLTKVAYATLRDRLAEAGVKTVVDLLHPDLPRPFTIATGFGCPAQPSLTLDERVLEARTLAAESLADSAATRARKDALGLVRRAHAAGAPVWVLALYHIVDQLSSAYQCGLAPALLISLAVDLGVDQADAALIVASLGQPAAPSTMPPPASPSPVAPSPAATPAGSASPSPVPVDRPVPGAGAPAISEAVEPVTEAVSRLTSARRGDKVLVTWGWPQGVALARVRVRAPGRDQRFEIGRARYDATGGCWLDLPGEATIEVMTVTVTPSRTLVSVGTTVGVSPRPMRVTYTLGPRRLWRWRDRRHVVTMTSSAECPELDAVVIASPGMVLPLLVSQGTVVARERALNVGPEREHVMTVDIPASIRPPYWIRCFVERPAGCVVVDPPVEYLRVER